ncbi:MAG TPA: nucleotide sugar dehydrogenase [Polyangiaceae bacterium]|nr:nucleotide sugar dehydrogenase [Polyangiaceae bacterium]
MPRPELAQKIRDKSAHVVVIGIGYVGLPLLVEFARAGYRATGLDSDEKKVESVRRGESYVPDVINADLTPHVQSQRLSATSDPSVIARGDAVIICVPTPLNKSRDPDIRHIVAAADLIACHQHSDMLVVLESTSYPGTTTELLVPRLTRAGYELGTDIFVAFSPERVDPGNRVYRTRNTPKVIGGVTANCLEMAQLLYSPVIDRLVPVSSTETAEMVKLLENTFRAVNIGLVNELCMISRKFGIDAFEVVRAAATKPFGFMPFYPGPGLGGHCIPVDPLYLSWRLRADKHQARFIELADVINNAMPDYVVSRAAEVLNDQSKAVRGSRLLIYGVAYKRDVPDVRESPALDVIHGLIQRGAHVEYMDPLVPQIDQPPLQLNSQKPNADFAGYDLVLVLTDHTALDRPRLLREARAILDTRDAFQGARAPHLHRL